MLDFLFGSEPETGVIDRRLPREPQGVRFWQVFDRMYGPGGPLDANTNMQKSMAALDQMMGWQPTRMPMPNGQVRQGFMSAALANAPVKLNFGGQEINVTPRWARQMPFQYAQAVNSMMQPWYQAGMQLEQNRIGTPYQTEGSKGLMGSLLDGASTVLGGGLGGAALGGIFGKDTLKSLFS